MLAAFCGNWLMVDILESVYIYLSVTSSRIMIPFTVCCTWLCVFQAMWQESQSLWQRRTCVKLPLSLTHLDCPLYIHKYPPQFIRYMNSVQIWQEKYQIMKRKTLSLLNFFRCSVQTLQKLPNYVKENCRTVYMYQG